MASMLFRRSRSIALVLVAALGIGIGYGLGAHSHSQSLTASPGGQAVGTARLAALLRPAKAAPGDPIFMKVSGVPGESIDARHADWIDLTSWSWNVSHKSGKAPAFSTISVTFAANRALPPLLADLARGKLLTTVTLQAVQSGAQQQQQIVTITLSGVTVTRAEDNSSGERPDDSLAMSFRRIDYKYNYQRSDGSLQAYDFCWNLAASKGC
jgi:type VI secretion system secreted protein Hcp